jgi:hypothetical protein
MKTQECDEPTMIDQGIRIGIGMRKEIPGMKFESDEVDGQTVSVGLSFCRFVERFDCFQTSILGCFKPSLSLIAHCNVDFHFFLNQEVMIRTIELIYLVSPNDRTDYHQIFSHFF